MGPGMCEWDSVMFRLHEFNTHGYRNVNGIYYDIKWNKDKSCINAQLDQAFIFKLNFRINVTTTVE